MVDADHGGGAASSVGHGVDGEDDFIMMDDFVQDVVEGRGDNYEDLGEVAATLDPEDA